MKGVVHNIMKVVAIDHGYSAIKATDGNKIISFQSRIEETNETINTNKTYKITYNNKTYIVGAGANSNYIEYDKTANEINKIYTLVALSKLMDTNYESFKLVTGYPLNLFNANKNIFAKYLKAYDIPFEIDGIRKRITIDDCIVFPQGAGSLFVNPNYYRDKIIAVLDIGGLTVNGVVFENLNLNSSSMFTINLGTIILFNKLRKVLNSKFTTNIQEYEIQNILQNGLIINGEKQSCKEVIDEIFTDHCKQIKAECRKYNWNIETLDILVTGGGALVLDGYIQQILPQSHIVDDPVHSNCKGFYNIGGHYYA
jgi:plasmid segregation protein ParM